MIIVKRLLSKCHLTHHHQIFYRFQTGITFHNKSVVRLIILCVFAVFLGYAISVMMMTLNVFTRNQSYRTHPEEIYQLALLQRFLESKHPSVYKQQEEKHADKLKEEEDNDNNYNYDNKNGIPQQKTKYWMRISDTVFVYSAHLDTRNFTTSYHPIANNLSREADSGIGVDSGGQRMAGGGGDSDKLRHVVLLVRIVGMKAVPPLRKFIKGDILDWFRIKHEMDYSKKYKCKLFFTSLLTKGLESVSSSKVTYTVIEEGVKIYAACYFNCYFNVSSSVYRSIMAVARADNLQVAMYPTDVSDYPTKLIDVGTLMTRKTERKVKRSHSHVEFDSKSLSICVRPLFGPFDDLEKLTQFISYYHVMGITQFNFYAMSISPRVRKYLLEIMRKKQAAATATTTNKERRTLPRFILRDWNVPTGNTSELWDYGTLAALNDCLFSNIDQEFVIFVDVDEFIVPRIPSSSSSNFNYTQANARHHQQLPNLWTIIDSYNSTKTYQYLIRNTFFCHEFCQNVENDTKHLMNFSSAKAGQVHNKPDVTPILSTATSSPFPANNSSAEFIRELPIILRCFARTKRVWNAAMRSKFIVNPRQVLAVGHHLVTKYVEKVDFRFSGRSVQVDPSIALLHHYRECTSISSKKHPVLTRLREIDKTMLRFERRVLDHLFRYYGI